MNKAFLVGGMVASFVAGAATIFGLQKANLLSVTQETAISSTTGEATDYPAGAEVEREDFNDWVLLCTPTETGRRCAVVQQLTNPGDRRLILGISLRKTEQGTVALVLHTPLAVSLNQGVSLAVNDVAIAKLPFTLCQSAQCQATATLTPEVANAVTEAEKITVSYQGQSGEPVNVSASVRGLREAYAALQQ